MTANTITNIFNTDSVHILVCVCCLKKYFFAHLPKAFIDKEEEEEEKEE